MHFDNSSAVWKAKHLSLRTEKCSDDDQRTDTGEEIVCA